ncbi:MAG: CDP-alcohol phosphatidyltransferase family protein [Bacteroidota bacterium]
MKQHLPNLITLTNLFLGCCAIVFILRGELLVGVGCLAGGALADFLDGLVARALGVSSPLGKELDSLADLVSFGVAPAMILFELVGAGSWAFPVFVLAMAAGYRLAKFNLDTRQTYSFLGLPTPACTIYVAGLALIVSWAPAVVGDVVQMPVFIYANVIVLSVLLISEIPMFSFKFDQLTLKGNEIKFIFAAISLVLIVAIPIYAPSMIIALYVGLNVVLYARHKIVVK